MDEAELAAGRVQVGEASILWHNEVDISERMKLTASGWQPPARILRLARSTTRSCRATTKYGKEYAANSEHS